MKMLFTSLLHPALMLGSLIRLHASPRNAPSTTIRWPRLKWARRIFSNPAKNDDTEQVESFSYYSLMVKGARYYAAKNYAAALAKYRRVLIEQPRDGAALSGKAWSLYYLGQEAQAAKDFEILLEMDKGDAWAQQGMALCVAKTKVAA